MTGTLTGRSEYRGNIMLQLLRSEDDKKPMQLGYKKAIKVMEKMGELVDFIESGAGDEAKFNLAEAGDKFSNEITHAQARFFMERISDIENFVAEEQTKGTLGVVPGSQVATGKFTEVKVHKMTGDGTLKAFCSCVVAGVVKVKSMRLVEGRNGLFLAMPSRKKDDGSYDDYVEPISKEARKELESMVLDAYNQAA